MIGWYLNLGRWSVFTPEQLKECKQHKLSGVIIQAMNGTEQTLILDLLIDVIKEAKIPFALQHTVDTTDRHPNVQAKGFRELVNEYKPATAIVEITHWWRSWNEMRASLAYTSNGNVTRLTSDTLNRWGRNYLQAYNKEKKIPILVSSPNWYVRKYSRPLAGTFRSLSDGYLGGDIRYQAMDTPIDWKEFLSDIEQFIPKRMMTTPAVHADGYDLGFFPVHSYPMASAGIIFNTKLFGSIKDMPTGMRAESGVFKGAKIIMDNKEEPEEEFPEGS